MMSGNCKLLEIVKISKRGTSLRITLPKKVAEKLSIGSEEFLGFYSVNGEIVVRRIK